MSDPSFLHAVRVGGFIVLLYALCIIWPQLYPYSEEVQNFHLLSLQLSFPGFQGMTAGSMLWGAVLSFVYGVLGSLVFHSFHKGCCRGK